MIEGVYLAYPIDQRGPASLEFLFQQVEQLKYRLTDANLVSWIFDPGDAFRVSHTAVMSDRGLPAINRAALNFADVVVAFLPRDVPSIGVPMEIDRARAQGKHVIVVSDARAWMLEMPGVHRVADWEDDSIDIIISMIRQMDRPNPSPQYHDLPFQMLGEFGQLPKRAYDDDAGLDLTVAESVVIQPGQFMDVPTQVAVQLEPQQWGLIVGRSSAFRSKSLLVLPGVIDAGYRGELFSAVYNTNGQPVRVERGERVAQLIVMNNATRYVTPIEYDSLLPSPRGTRGFGSSGA